MHYAQSSRRPAATAMTSPDNALWQQCWRERRTGFHQTTVNPLLERFWPALGLAPGSRVFVPLCGKSLDMLWLARQGLTVIGVELSPVAVRAFFKENRLQPRRRPAGDLTLWEQGAIQILCGDYFALTSADLGPIDVVYDRAALTALPEEARRRYVAHLGNLVPAARVFLLTTEDRAAGETQAQAEGADAEITALYSERFLVELTHGEPEQAETPAGEGALCKLYRLTPRSAQGAGLSPGV